MRKQLASVFDLSRASTILSKKQYRKLCKACDAVLMAGSATMETVAIPWLHVIREHPALLEKYRGIFDCLNKTQSIAHYLLIKGKTFAVYVRQLIRSIKSRGRLWLSSKKIPSSVDYLFISHLLSPSQCGNLDDFYFGELPEKLAAREYSVAIALINHSGKSATLIKNQWKKSRVARIILSDSLSLCDEIVHYLRLRKESNRLRAEALRQSGFLERMVYLRGADEALSNGALGALRVGSQVGRLVAQMHAKTVIFTHEGHAWERIVIATARRANPIVRCIGYQHAAVFKLQHALRRKLSSEYNPDKILTAGLVGKRQLEASPGLRGIPIAVLGSNRATRQKKQESYLKMTNQKQNIQDSVCLVLPEGIPSECHYLLNFSIACLKALPKIRFICRLHPVIDLQKLRFDNFQLKILPAALRISNASLESDLAQSNMVLYRGSTAAIQAVAAGLKPFYLQLKSEININPLYEIDHCISKIKNVIEFGEAVAQINKKKVTKTSKKNQFMINYCKKFYVKIDPSVINKKMYKNNKHFIITPKAL